MSFLKAFGATLGAVGFPVVVRVLFAGGTDAGSWAFVLLFLLGMAVCAGLVWAVRSVLRRRAYNRLTSGPF